MTKRIRRFAAALLLLALPMQVFAVSSMHYCDGDHHATWLQVATNVSFDDSVAGAPAHERSGHHDVGAADAADKSSGASHHHDDGAPGGDDHRGSQCSSSAASIPSSDQSTLTLAPARSAAISVVAEPVSGYVPERLERPPRSTLV